LDKSFYRLKDLLLDRLLSKDVLELEVLSSFVVFPDRDDLFIEAEIAPLTMIRLILLRVVHLADATKYLYRLLVACLLDHWLKESLLVLGWLPLVV